MGSTSETWRPVLGFEGYYEVSDHGNVRSLDRMVYAGRGRTREARGRVLSIYTGDSYSKVRLKVDGTGSTKNVHNLVADAFLEPPPRTGLDVCHNNGNPHDNRVENLRYDTHSGNMSDRIEHGTAYSRRTKPECINGHIYVDGSYYVDKGNGKRVCLVCDRERHRHRVDRKHELAGTVRRSERTKCVHGHALDGVSSRGKRFCKTCQREAQRRYRAKKDDT